MLFTGSTFERDGRNAMGRFSLPEEKPPGLDKPGTAKFIKAMSKFNTGVFKLTNGRLGAKWRVGEGFKKPPPILLLEHVGRKSGKTFTAPLVYRVDGDNLIVVASQGGLPKNPQWFGNLIANPDTVVHLPKDKNRKVRARVAQGEERMELWAKMVEMYSDFEKYAVWTDREIPIVLLEPR
jgi:deazaflavin-dependent oxidoreductase (nitroreductase family)